MEFLGCLTTIGLYGDGVLKLPITSLTEGFKCTKARLQMTLNESKDIVVKENAPTLATGHKWRPATAVEEATSALMQNIQQERGDPGLTTSHPAWRNATAAAWRKMVVEVVHCQEEPKAVSLGMQGQWT